MLKKASSIFCICITVLSGISCQAKRGKDSSLRDEFGEETQRNNGEKIIIKASAYGSYDTEPGKSWVRIVETFENENPEIDIQYELLDFADYHRKIGCNLLTGNFLDIAYMGTDVRWYPACFQL